MLAYQDFATEDMDLHFAQYINIELDVILTDMFDRHYNRIRDVGFYFLFKALKKKK